MDKIFISVAEDHMKEKNYNPKAVVIAQDLGYIQEGNRVINRREFTTYLQRILKITKYKCKKIIDTFVDTGILLQHDNDSNILIMPALKTNFLKLLRSTTKFCIDGISDFAFKVYCYLFNKYNINQTYCKHHKENFFFSKKQILADLGYSRGQDKLVQLTNVLTLLQDLKMINYNEKGIGRPGNHGTYHELYKVNEYSPTQVRALNVTIEELGVDKCPELVKERDMLVEKEKFTLPEKNEGFQF